VARLSNLVNRIREEQLGLSPLTAASAPGFLLIDEGLMDADKVEIVSEAQDTAFGYQQTTDMVPWASMISCVGPFLETTNQLCQIVISLLLPLVLRPTMAP
jgi:hypothetical protein